MILHIHLWCIFCSMIPTRFTPKMAQCAASTKEMNAGREQNKYNMSLPARCFFRALAVVAGGILVHNNRDGAIIPAARG